MNVITKRPIDVVLTLTGYGHPWISRYVRNARLSCIAGLLTRGERIDDTGCRRCLMIELCGCGHRCRRNGWRRWCRWYKSTRCTTILMMMAQRVVDHWIGRTRCYITRETCSVTTRFVTRCGVNCRSKCRTRCRWRTKTWYHWRTTKSSSGYGLLLLMMMMCRRSGNIWIHAWCCPRGRWRWCRTTRMLWTRTRRTRWTVLRVISGRGSRCRQARFKTRSWARTTRTPLYRTLISCTCEQLLMMKLLVILR